jgi:hypothetical protein
MIYEKYESKRARCSSTPNQQLGIPVSNQRKEKSQNHKRRESKFALNNLKKHPARTNPRTLAQD